MGKRTRALLTCRTPRVRSKLPVFSAQLTQHGVSMVSPLLVRYMEVFHYVPANVVTESIFLLCSSQLHILHTLTVLVSILFEKVVIHVISRCVAVFFPLLWSSLRFHCFFSTQSTCRFKFKGGGAFLRKSNRGTSWKAIVECGI